MDEKSVDYYMNLPYDIALTKKDGRFILFISELHLIVQDEDLNEAYRQLEGERRSLFEKHFETGNHESIPLPGRVVQRRELAAKLTPFLIKASVVALIVIGLVVGAGVAVTYTLENTPRNVGQKATRYMARNFIRSIDKSLTPEREKKIRLALRQAVPRLKPLAEELAPLFGCPNRQGG